MRRTCAELLLLAVHELRDPIAVIVGYARMLSGQQGGSLSARERRELVATLERSAQELVRLVDELSDIANLERNTLPFNYLELPLESLLDGVVAELNVARPKGGPSMDVGGTAADVKLRADPVRLPRALNAIFSDVAVRAGDDTELVVRHEIRVAKRRRAVALVVGDRRAVDRLLASRVRRVRFGEGDKRLRLGGRLACRIVEAHGGQVWSTPAGPAIIELPIESRHRKRRSGE